MELNDQDQSLIKKYLFRRLTQAEEMEFSTRIGQDQDFRGEVEFQRDLFAALGDREHERLKKKLSDLESKHFPSAPKPNYTRWLLLAFLALLAAWLVWRFAIVPSEPEPEQIFADYFIPFENTVEIATREQGGGSAKAAWQAYDAGDYGRAVELFERLPEGEQSAASRFFQANALLHEGKAREALVLLEEKMAGNQFEEQRLWYAALACVYLGDYGKAKELLEEIRSKTGHFKFREAEELLGRLE